MPKLTVTVITQDEEANIGACLDSVAWADEIVVVDSGSTDGTVAIARSHSARVDVRPWTGFGAQRNHAASIASHDWILALDADERVSPGLAAEIRALLATEPTRRGYRMPRVTWYLGRWIRGTDWYPNYRLRLYDRRAGDWNDRRVHETLTLNGDSGVLQHELQHFAYRNISDHLSTIDRYTTLAAEQWIAEGRRSSLATLILHPPLAFLRNYVLKAGFTQGAAGLLVSVLNSYYVFLKMAKLWELTRGARHRTSSVDARPSPLAPLSSDRPSPPPRPSDRHSPLTPRPSDHTSHIAPRPSD